MSATPRDRIHAELEKLRSLQPDLTRDQALTFFKRFHPSQVEADVLFCVDQADLARSPGPRTPKAERVRRQTDKPKSTPLPVPKAVSGPRPTKPAPQPEAQRPVCPSCGRDVDVSSSGKVKAHKTSRRGARACVGSGRPLPGWINSASAREARLAQEEATSAHKLKFVDQSGVPTGELAPSDLEWMDGEGWLTSIALAQPSDIVTARRVLLAASNGRVRPATVLLVQAWYQAMKKRPDLFDPRKSPQKWLEAVEGDPQKRLNKPATPGKSVYYREVLVGKRD